MSKRFLICVHLQGAPFVQAQRTPEIPIEINEDDQKADSRQELLDLDGRNSQKYLHQTWAYF